ncbi:MAG: GAF domain-containing protein [Siphonobacter sp.]
MSILTIDLPQEVDIPLKFRLSFRPFITFIQQKQEQIPKDAPLYDLYNRLIDAFTPYLNSDSIEETTTADTFEKLAQLLQWSILPLFTNEKDLPFAFGLPVPYRLFYYSPPFGHLLPSHEKKKGLACDEHLRFVYHLILEKWYNIPFNKDLITSFTFEKEQNGVTTFYRIAVNANFLEPYLEDEIPDLQTSWIDFVNGRRQDPGGVPLPLESFTFEGFCIFFVKDITRKETLLQLRDIFAHLQTDSEEASYQRFVKGLRNLVGQPNLQVGLMPFLTVNGRHVQHPAYSSRSVLLKDEMKNESFIQEIITKLSDDPVPRIFYDLDDFPEEGRPILVDKGIRSFVLHPVYDGKEVLGVLELGNERANAFSETILETLQEILPLIQELLRYQRQQFYNSLERIIKQRYTPLQPSVEWKFNEVAWETLRNQAAGTPLFKAPQVQFAQVYPLYGAIDVRNSSLERHKAVRKDFSDQLVQVYQLLSTHSRETTQLLLEHTNYWQTRLLSGMTPEDEASIALFFVQEINPFLQALEPNEAIRTYFEQIDQSTGHFNQASRAYEVSLEWINLTVNRYIENEDKRLQTMHPHYFDKYRTDGMEYNLYIGQSVTPQIPFQIEYLTNLRLWQLNSMVEMARLTHELLPILPLPLQTTQLILVHSQPVNISFRQDEHRFDVDGSYSIRYEVIKKRIDKARIVETHERLTQPDTIALIYSNRREITDFEPLIKSLQHQHKLEERIDDVELEALQGVQGLRALRLYIKHEVKQLAAHE